jgi:hypothetical protein
MISTRPDEYWFFNFLAQSSTYRTHRLWEGMLTPSPYRIRCVVKCFNAFPESHAAWVIKYDAAIVPERPFPATCQHTNQIGLYLYNAELQLLSHSNLNACVLTSVVVPYTQMAEDNDQATQNVPLSSAQFKQSTTFPIKIIIDVITPFTPERPNSPHVGVIRIQKLSYLIRWISPEDFGECAGWRGHDY